MAENPPRRRRGRPSLDPDGRPSMRLCVTLTTDDYDAIYKVARQRRESIADVIRRGAKREITPPPRPPR